MNERKETLMRLIVLVISGIILAVWRYLIFALIILNFFWSLISGKRLKEPAEMSEIWNTQIYIFLRYITFVTNERPFPFKNLTKNISKFK